MKIRLGKNYTLEIISAGQYDKLYGAQMRENGVAWLVFGARDDAQKQGEQRYSDMGAVYRNGKLCIESRGVLHGCGFTDFVNSLKYTWN